MKNRIKNYAILMLIVGIILVTFGTTYAFFAYTKEGSKTNSITTGTITFHYDEKTGKRINLNSVLPLSDDAGKEQTVYFQYNITSTNTTDASIPYQVTLRKQSVEEDSIPEKDVKIYLTRVTKNINDEEIEEPILLDTFDRLGNVIHNNNSEKLVYAGNVSGHTANYDEVFRLRMWIDENADFSPKKDTNGRYIIENGEYVYPYNNKEFNVTVNVYTDIAEVEFNRAPGLYNSNGELVISWDELVTAGVNPITLNSDSKIIIDGIVSQNNLSNIDLVLADTVTSIDSYVFSSNSYLKKIEISKNVSTIGNNAFWNCSNLETVVINGDSIIGYGAFSGCGKLENIVLKKITAIGSNAFENCDSLVSVVMPNTLRTIGSAVFYGCDNLSSVTLNEGLEIIGENAFYNCSSLASITIPESVTTLSRQAFYGCSSLTSITIPSNVTTLGNYLFDGCSSLTTVTILGDIETLGTYIFNRSGVSTVRFLGNATSINDGFFERNLIVDAVEIGENVTSIGAYAFYSSSITSVTFLNKSGWISDGKTFTEEELADPATNATLLKSTYVEEWQRN